MNGLPARTAGGANVPVQENEPLVDLRAMRIASAFPGAHVHMSRGASIPRGQTVLS